MHTSTHEYLHTCTLTLGVKYLFGQLHHLVQLWVNVLVSLPQYLHQLLRLFCILRREVSVCGAGVLGPCGTANTVDIVFRVVGEVKVDHKFDVAHIYTRKPTSKLEYFSPNTQPHHTDEPMNP